VQSGSLSGHPCITSDQEVSRRIMRSFLLSASTQAASFVPPQYLDDENTVSSRPMCCTYPTQSHLVTPTLSLATKQIWTAEC